LAVVGAVIVLAVPYAWGMEPSAEPGDHDDDHDDGPPELPEGEGELAAVGAGTPGETEGDAGGAGSSEDSP
jgi:hypothetical protein